MRTFRMKNTIQGLYPSTHGFITHKCRLNADLCDWAEGCFMLVLLQINRHVLFDPVAYFLPRTENIPLSVKAMVLVVFCSSFSKTKNQRFITKQLLN